MTSPGMLSTMRAVMIDPPPEMLEERRRLGQDKRDEVWDGVVHMVPPASSPHQYFGSDLEFVLRRVCTPRGLRVGREQGVLAPETADFSNYRVPDINVAQPRFVSRRGVEGRAELVVEVLSPKDESRDKFDFYARCDVQEVWLVDPDTRAIEVYTLRGGKYFAVTPDLAGIVHAPVLAIDMTIVDGPKLRLVWVDGAEEI
jgi:Uma2 family endonuclease